ncbi:uncharacterized protein LOC123675304 [Harmonia axyridis]|uniref:uncharacterized protein LOC123675304 n=1 Tax=Harmonia axyridis TaxID=115357 RepID=UPI001E277ADD|nr:uncharacterized protein LOC123675304 [Harmonia axyridis]
MFKLAVFLSAVISAVYCVPQNYYFGNYETAPYQPSGWRPSGAAFRLPERQQALPTIYGPPQPEYGPPEPATTTEAVDSTTTEIPTTTEVNTEENEAENLSEQLKDGEQGAYYIFHPSGLLQKVTFATKDDLANMAYYARIKYEDVEPIRGPIYTYDPETAELKRIARRVSSAQEYELLVKYHSIRPSHRTLRHALGNLSPSTEENNHALLRVHFNSPLSKPKMKSRDGLLQSKMIQLAIFLSAVISVVYCVPQNYYFGNYETAPYQPSGWRPSGAAFRLPERQQVLPTIYGPPQPEYGPPEPATTTEAVDSTTTEIPTTTEVNTEENEAENLSEQLKDGEQGAYYIFHPSGLLQKVTFATKDDLANMAYYARVKYEDVEPIRGPIYTYDPESAELKRISRRVSSPQK